MKDSAGGQRLLAALDDIPITVVYLLLNHILFF